MTNPPPEASEHRQTSDQALVRPELAGLLPPADLDAEASVLSAMLLSEDMLERVFAEGLLPRHFFSQDNGTICLAMSDLHLAGKACDIVSVARRVREMGHEEALRAGYLGLLIDASPAVANALDHAGIVKTLSLQRVAIGKLHKRNAEMYRGELGEVLSALTSDVESLRVAHEAQQDDWTILGPEEIMAPLGPIPWVCRPLELAPGAPSMLMGSGYSRKTFAAQQLALAVATGCRVWKRWKPDSTGPVLHLDYEQGARLTSERYQRLAKAEGITIRDLRVAPFPPVYIDSPDYESALARRLDGHKLCIIDCLRAGLVETDENDSIVGFYVRRLARVSERTGCTILLIHHARKPPTDKRARGAQDKHSGRGSGAIFEACQCVIGLEGDSADEPSRAVQLKARVTGRGISPQLVMAEDVHDPECSEHLERCEAIGKAAAELGNDPPPCLRWGLQLWADKADNVADTVEASRDRGAREAALVAARRMALILASNPGLTRNELFSAVRAHLGRCSDLRCGAAREILRPALVLVAGTNSRQHHHLDGSKLPTDVTHELPPHDRAKVASCKPPTPREPDPFAS